MSTAQLRGTFTAIVTPFNADGSVDFSALDAFVDWQIEQGVQGLVPCGTTGESATMSANERADVISRVVQRAAGRVLVIAGAGANSTADAIEHQKRAADTGAAYALVVTPYYNRPSSEGLYRHYAALLESVDIPIILYNVPGRTACDMLPPTVARIAKLPGIAAIKEATGDLSRVHAIRRATPKDFAILSGDDPTAAAFCWHGGDGVISVTSNVAPKAFSTMIQAALGEKVLEARTLHNDLSDLFTALFLEANPIPVKAGLTLMEKIQEHYRLPLCPMDVTLRSTLEQVLKETKLI